MAQTDTWQTLLQQLIADPAERQRIANELGVRTITLTRWARGESLPRQHHLHHLLTAIPQQDRTQFHKLLAGAFPGLASNIPTPAKASIPQEIYVRVLKTFEEASL